MGLYRSFSIVSVVTMLPSIFIAILLLIKNNNRILYAVGFGIWAVMEVASAVTSFRSYGFDGVNALLALLMCAALTVICILTLSKDAAKIKKLKLAAYVPVCLRFVIISITQGTAQLAPLILCMGLLVSILVLTPRYSADSAYRTVRWSPAPFIIADAVSFWISA